MSGRQAFETWDCLPVHIGELVALSNDGRTPLVIDPARPEARARRAHTVVDLHAGHIGQKVVLLSGGVGITEPVILGVLRDADSERPEAVVVESDGERTILSARQQLVLRCGKACITLTRAGKVLIEGSYILSRSTGANRIKGGSVQLN